MGHSLQEITCLSCNNVSSKKEQFIDINLPLEGDGASLQALLSANLNQEEVLSKTGSNEYYCSKCEGHVNEANKKVTIVG